MAARKRVTRPFPSKEEVLAFIREQDSPVGKKEIARAFHIRGDDRIALKALLKELQEEGELDRLPGRRLAESGVLPEVMVLEVVEIDADGELLARPAVWREKAPPPRIYLAPERRGRPAIGPGERVLARLTRLADGTYEARPIRVLGGAPRRLIGVYEVSDRGGRLRPTDRRAKTDYILHKEDAAGARPGELLLVESKGHHPRLGLREVRVVERLGRLDATRALSLISIHEHDLPTVFSAAALDEAAAAGPATPAGREDLRQTPLVTIDGADARDFDDAVWAEPDSDPENPGGWHLLVAIADVAHYVRPGRPLDIAAYERGNSAYFPDRVVPMLPEALSNGWCSLKPGEERPCLAVQLWIDADGAPLRHRFLRGLMRSTARLTYEQVQAARDGRPDETTGPLLEDVIGPLYGAFQALAKARDARGTLDLEIPESQVLMNDQGEVEAIRPRPRLDSHRLIEEFMIAANVAAAEALEARHQPCMYRVHDTPDPQKLEALRQVLDEFGLRLARGQVVRPRIFQGILAKARGRPYAAMVNDLILRAQSQAAYAPDNIGHFGLALARYAHFTSPIRRYADLLVHRALIAGYGMGKGGLPEQAGERFAESGQHISMTERRAQAAEREAMDRFAAAFLQPRIGEVFTGRVTGVTRFGLFIALDETGADGLLPMSSLPDDYYVHIEAEHRLVGRRWGRTYTLGEKLAVRLAEADPITGGLVLAPAESEEPGPERDETTGPAAGWDPLRGDKPKPGGGKGPRGPAGGRGSNRGAGRPPGRGGRRRTRPG
jgi:ribonuclease R